MSVHASVSVCEFVRVSAYTRIRVHVYLQVNHIRNQSTNTNKLISNYITLYNEKY